MMLEAKIGNVQEVDCKPLMYSYYSAKFKT